MRFFLGYVYEVFFKAGFLDFNEEFLENAKKFLLYNNSHTKMILKENKELNELILRYFSGRFERFRDKSNKELFYTDYIINLAITQGNLYRRREIENIYGVVKDIIKYDMGEGSSIAGNYRNADLMFKTNKNILFVVEIKTDKVLDILNDININIVKDDIEDLTNRDFLKLPIKLSYSVPVKLSVGRMTISNFLRGLRENKDIFERTNIHVLDTVAYIQALSYALSYLEESKDEDIKNIKIEVIHPFTKLFSPILSVDNKNINQVMKDLSDLTSELYKNIKEKKTDELLKKIISDGKQKEEIKIIYEILNKELNKRNVSEPEKINAEKISAVRKSVRALTEDFVRRRIGDKDLKVLGLFHSAGSGKTTSIREISTTFKKIAVFYFASRRILVLREKSEYEKLGFSTCEPSSIDNTETEHIDIQNKLVISKVLNTSNRSNILQEEKKHGNLNKISNCLQNFKDKPKIGVFTTIQSITNTYRTNTIRHILSPIENLISEGYKVFLILDEVVGDDGGIDAILNIFKFFYNKDVFLFILDANLYSSNILEILLEDYKNFGFIQPSLYQIPFKEKHIFDFSRTIEGEKLNVKNIECYTKHGFVSSLGYINIKDFYIRVSDEKRRNKNYVESLSEIIKEIGNKSEYSVMIFFQNKELGQQLKRYLDTQEHKAITINTTLKVSEEEINTSDYKYIISTSTASRGLSFTNVKDIVVIFENNNVEENIVEVIQAISRGRGNEHIEEEERFIYLLFKVDETVIFNENKYYYDFSEDILEYLKIYYKSKLIKQIINLSDITKMIIKQFVNTPSENKNVLVPVPAFFPSYYQYSVFDSIISINTLLKDILTANVDNIYMYQAIIKKLVSSAISIQARVIDSNYSYVHPYLISSRGTLPILSSAYLKFSKKKMNALIRYVNIIKNTIKNEEHKKIIEKALDELSSKLIKTTRGEELDIEEKFYILIPLYTKELVNYLETDEKVVFSLSSTINGIDTIGKEFNVITFGQKMDKISNLEPCVLLLSKQIANVYYLNSFTQKVSPSFLYEMLKEGDNV